MTDDDAPKPLDPSTLGPRLGLYTLVGQTISVWANMETTLVYIFAILLGTTNQKAGLVMFTIMNFNNRLEIISDLFANDEKHGDLARSWNQKADRLRAMNDTRVRLAHHTIWESDLKGPPALNPSRLDTRPKARAYKPLGEAELDSFAEALAKINQELYDFHLTLFRKHHEIEPLPNTIVQPPAGPLPSGAQ